MGSAVRIRIRIRCGVVARRGGLFFKWFLLDFFFDFLLLYSFLLSVSFFSPSPSPSPSSIVLNKTLIFFCLFRSLFSLLRMNSLLFFFFKALRSVLYAYVPFFPPSLLSFSNILKRFWFCFNPFLYPVVPPPLSGIFSSSLDLG